VGLLHVFHQHGEVGHPLIEHGAQSLKAPGKQGHQPIESVETLL